MKQVVSLVRRSRRYILMKFVLISVTLDLCKRAKTFRVSLRRRMNAWTTRSTTCAGISESGCLIRVFCCFLKHRCGYQKDMKWEKPTHRQRWRYGPKRPLPSLLLPPFDIYCRIILGALWHHELLVQSFFSLLTTLDSRPTRISWLSKHIPL